MANLKFVILMLFSAFLLNGNAQSKAFLPMPQQLKFTHQPFQKTQCRILQYNDSALRDAALQLVQILAANDWPITIKNQLRKPSNLIKLVLTKNPHQQHGAYELIIEKNKMALTANSIEGIFNGLQTFQQWLTIPDLPTCKIKDWPAFAWRGFMVDVGRNYIPLEQLKELIDRMGYYKLNTFHFHATEDIAWRFEIKQYPQLTAAENMLRNKGNYYTVSDIKELIQYCKERHIQFIPELDMPGHSAAFKRAMNVDMQSTEGIRILKNILTEIANTYDINYIHIGADEVKIVNQNFIPEISHYIQGLGMKIIGWQPGGNFVKNTIRQLWMDDLGKITNDPNIRYLDSRHLYINHMDPLEAVTTIFNRQISNKTTGDSTALGAILCVWHDRNVNTSADIFKMNPVYPSLLAFAERSWRGGGTNGWIANIIDGDSIGFKDFETRLLYQQKIHFRHLPFPYSKQSDQVWELYGPYFNQGNLTTKFAPELSEFSSTKKETNIKAIGGTVVLRHWWAPLIKGAITNAKDSSTWYACTSIWSNSNCIKSYWIGFNNVSRSPATDTPPKGAWDEKQSCIWVNNQLIKAPEWKNAGSAGNAETPLIDEGYEYRTPTKISLQKGWNHVLIKCPVGSFKGKNWQNPIKWMFTFIEAPNLSE